MFDWLRPKTATRAELETQLSAAQKTLAAAKEATASAVADFDEDPSASATKALMKAREAEAAAGEHLGRAERLFAAAVEREAKQKRAALIEQERELEASLTHTMLEKERAESLAAEVDALILATKAHAKRCAVESAIDARRSKLENVRRELGKPVDGLRYRLFHGSNEPSDVDVGDALAAYAASREGESAHRGYLNKLGTIFRESPRLPVLGTPPRPASSPATKPGDDVMVV